MGPSEKLTRALSHTPGPVPVDFGSTSVTGMHVTCVAGLREHYGLEKRPVKVCEPYQMLGLIEDDLVASLGVDTVGAPPRNTLFGFPLSDWKSWRTPWGQELLVPGKFNATRKGNDIYLHPEGDTSIAPSGRMPAGGWFFDTIVRQDPIVEEQLDPNDNLEEFGPISDEDVAYFARTVKAAAATGRGVVANFGGTAFGDIALVPAPFLRAPKGIRDIEEWYISTATRPEYVHSIFGRQLEYALANLDRIRKVAGGEVLAVFICGTDFGTQRGPFCSTVAFDQLWRPYYRKLNDWIHANTGWKTFKHSCGGIEPLLDSLIESGFDIINPVQCSADGMDPALLKSKYGDRLVFWGAGVDTQRTLPFGTPAQVRQEVLQRCAVFSRNGGFVFNAIHNVQANTPVANIVAMVDAVREFNGQ